LHETISNSPFIISLPQSPLTLSTQTKHVSQPPNGYTLFRPSVTITSETAPNGLFYSDVPIRKYSVIHSFVLGWLNTTITISYSSIIKSWWSWYLVWKDPVEEEVVGRPKSHPVARQAELSALAAARHTNHTIHDLSHLHYTYNHTPWSNRPTYSSHLRFWWSRLFVVEPTTSWFTCRWQQAALASHVDVCTRRLQM